MNVFGRGDFYAEVKQSSPRLYGIADFGGEKIVIPGAEQDDNRYFTLNQAEEIRKYYAGESRDLAALGHLLSREEIGRMGGDRGHCAARRTVLCLPQKPSDRHGQERSKLRHRFSS